MNLLTIGQVAKRVGVTVEAIRFYERQGLLAQPRRTASGYRQYPPEAVRRIRFIQRAKDVGFSLKEIRELLSLREESGIACADIKARAVRTLAAIEGRLHDLERMRNALARLAVKCDGKGQLGECPILDALDQEEHGGDGKSGTGLRARLPQY